MGRAARERERERERVRERVAGVCVCVCLSVSVRAVAREVAFYPCSGVSYPPTVFSRCLSLSHASLSPFLPSASLSVLSSAPL